MTVNATSETDPDLSSSDAAIKNPILSTVGLTTKVVKGTLWTLTGHIAPMAIALITTPFTIRLLGAEGYGVYILIVLVPTYLGFADFGMNIASTKFASEAYADGDVEKEARIVRTASLIALCSSIPLALGLFLLSGWIITLFNIPESQQSNASLALKIAAITFVISIQCNVFNTPQLTRLRMELNTLVTSGFRILGMIAIPIVLYFGFGVVGAVTVLLITSVLTLIGVILISKSLLKNLFDTTFDGAAGSRQILRFGGAFAISGIAAVLLANLEKSVLAATISTTALAHYSVAFTLAGLMSIFSVSMAQSLIPAFSRLQSPDHRIQLDLLYSRVIRISLICIIPLLVVVALAAKPFFGLWAGREFEVESSIPFYILLLGLFFNQITHFPGCAILAAGKSGLVAKVYWLELLPYGLLVWILASRFGTAGAAAAWSLRVTVDTLGMFFLAHHYVGVKLNSEKIGYLFIAIAMMLVPLIMMFLGFSMILVAIALLACFAGYVAIVFWRILEAEEISWLLTSIGIKMDRVRL